MLKGIQQFFHLEEATGLLLVMVAALALVVSNSPLEPAYHEFLRLRLEIIVGDFRLGKPLQLWISEGLMAVFFFLVGLEIKRELLQGELSSRQQAILPLIAAVGGMAAPAAIFVWINAGDPAGLRGWAIPSATDIAFALGVLSLAGKAVPLSLKVLLTAIAILDDLGAIIIIALFYAENLNPQMLTIAALCTAGLVVLNRRGVTRIAPYILLGAIMWVSVLKSGIHATLAGVITALAIPLRAPDGSASPSLRLEDALHPWVAYVVLPLFAFANAGVSLSGLTWNHFAEPVALGVLLGLVVGKAIGVAGAIGVAVALRVARLPEGVDWRGILGVACLCGIGFTMSLFIGALAFETQGPAYMDAVRLGVLGGSTVSAPLGVAVFRWLMGSRSSISRSEQ